MRKMTVGLVLVLALGLVGTTLAAAAGYSHAAKPAKTPTVGPVEFSGTVTARSRHGHWVRVKAGEEEMKLHVGGMEPSKRLLEDAVRGLKPGAEISGVYREHSHLRWLRSVNGPHVVAAKPARRWMPQDFTGTVTAVSRHGHWVKVKAAGEELKLHVDGAGPNSERMERILRELRPEASISGVYRRHHHHDSLQTITTAPGVVMAST
jgi:hypothetical protein